jgi:hypothetical protein
VESGRKVEDAVKERESPDEEDVRMDAWMESEERVRDEKKVELFICF